MGDESKKASIRVQWEMSSKNMNIATSVRLQGGFAASS